MPGNELTEAREKKGVTLEEATEILKISKTYLYALEHEEFNNLPEPVFARGYIKSYCQFLGVDPKRIFDGYNEFVSAREPEKFESLKSPARPEMGKIRFSRFSIGIMSGIILLIVVVSVLSYQIKKEKSKLAVRAKLETELANNASDMFNGNRTAGNNTQEKDDFHGNVVKDRYADMKTLRNKKVMGDVVQDGEVQGLKLDLEARELTWLYVVPDSGSPIDVTLYPGDKLRIKAKKTIKFKVGNAGGVDATLNGKKIGPLGKSGEVVEKTLRAGEQG